MQVCAGFDADPARPVLVAVAGPTFKIKLLTYTSKLSLVSFVLVLDSFSEDHLTA